MSSEPSGYLEHLPQIFQAATPGDQPFLGDFLKILEALLAGRTDADVGDERVKGLEETISGFVSHLDPTLVPVTDPASELIDSEFLSYLASWVALQLDENWDLEKKRDWLRRIVPLYKRRGTKDGLTAYLNTFVGNQVSVEELPRGFIVGDASHSTVGVTSFIAGAPAYYFRVRIEYAYATPFDISEWVNIRKGTRQIVDLEKPAHTYYTLNARTPGFIVGERATIATDTLIWENSKEV